MSPCLCVRSSLEHWRASHTEHGGTETHCPPHTFRRRLQLALPRTFKCPSCTAPLDVPSSTSEAVPCSYCGSSVLIHDVTGDGVDWDVETGEPPSVDEFRLLRHIAEIVRRGNKIHAIKVYRLGFGTGLKDAKDAVERLERGDRIVFTEQLHVVDTSRLQEALVDAARALEDNLPSARSAGIFFLALAAVVVLVLGGIAVAVVYVLRASVASQEAQRIEPVRSDQPSSGATGGVTSTNPAVADVVLAFGTDGIGPGQFRDARSVAVDRTGRIYAADYIGGRVQIFDPSGGFVGQWMMNPRTALHRLATDDASVCVLQAGKVSRHEPGTGRQIATLPWQTSEWIDDLAFGLDGSVSLIGRSETIVRLRPDGSRVLEVRDAISQITDRTELSVRIAVDGNGDIYLLAGFQKAVFRFSASGKFLNRFGSGGDGPGQLRSPNDIAVDGQGRVYVSDSSGIHVFAGDGRYLADFAPGTDVVFGLAFDDRGDLYAACRTRIVKFRLNPSV